MDVEKILDDLDRKPWLPRRAVWYLFHIIDSTRNCTVFEWGAGSSSLFFTDHAIHVYSVEHDSEWIREVYKRMKNREKWDCEYYKYNGDWKPFSDDILRTGIFYDIILIDGAVIDDKSSREMCATNALLRIKSGGCIVLDNSDTSPDAAKLLKDTCSSYVLIYDDGYLGKWETGFYFYG